MIPRARQNVFRRLHEAQGDHVDAELEAEPQVGDIFVGDGEAAVPRPGALMPLCSPSGPPVHDDCGRNSSLAAYRSPATRFGHRRGTAGRRAARECTSGR